MRFIPEFLGRGRSLFVYPAPGALPRVSDLFVDGFLPGRVTERYLFHMCLFPSLDIRCFCGY